MMTWTRNRNLLGALKLKGIAKPRTSLRSWGASVTGLSHPAPRRCYASGSESSITEVEKILLDTIKVRGLSRSVVVLWIALAERAYVKRRKRYRRGRPHRLMLQCDPAARIGALRTSTRFTGLGGDCSQVIPRSITPVDSWLPCSPAEYFL